MGSTIEIGDVTVSDGLFTVPLDFGSGAFDGNARWLGIGVRPGSSSGAYTALAPRQALTATPYALYAKGAPWSGLTGGPAGFADGVDNDTTYSAGTGLLALMSEQGLAGSNSEARRLIQQGGVRLDDQIIRDVRQELIPDGKEHVLQVGKRKFLRITS